MKYFSMFTGIGGFELGIKQAYDNNNLGRVTETSDTEDRRNMPLSAVSDGDGWGTHSDSLNNSKQVYESNNAHRGQDGGKPTDTQVINEAGQGLLATQGQDTGSPQRPVGKRLTDGTDERPLCVGFSEIDKYASQLLSIKWPTVKNYGDATKIDERQLPDFDLLVGGFPCQSFSIAGKRKGFDDTRGTLFFDIARILAYKKPSYLVLENVKGLLSHDGGETFQAIIGVLTDLGYFVEWQVLNSKNFGVPQNRERVFIVGHLGGIPKRKVFPVGESSKQIIEQIIGGRETERVYGTDGVSPTINTAQGGQRQPKIGIRINRVDRKTKTYDLKKSDISGALTSTMWKGIDASGRTGVIDGIKIRRLTPLECERLQGFPDNWTAGFSDTQRYKMCGNAVTVNVVQYVISKMLL